MIMKEKMKSIIRLLSLTVVATIMFASCLPDKAEYKAGDLVGKWVLTKDGVQGTEFWRYDADGTGATWDTADDVSEDEAQAFDWSLEGDQLTQIHKLESSAGVVPMVYTITGLTVSELDYKDDYGRKYVFTKVNP